jgi:putative addiction module killer protein
MRTQGVGGESQGAISWCPARIVARIRRMEQGNPGDTRSVGKGIVEMRIAYGPGYRIYYLHRGAQIVILLCGGDKRTQRQDIEQAHV